MVKIYEGLVLMAEVALERSAYAFSIRLAANTILEGAVYSFQNGDWRVLVSDGYRAKGFSTRADAMRALAKHYKLGKFADDNA